MIDEKEVRSNWRLAVGVGGASGPQQNQVFRRRTQHSLGMNGARRPQRVLLASVV